MMGDMENERKTLAIIGGGAAGLATAVAAAHELRQVGNMRGAAGGTHTGDGADTPEGMVDIIVFEADDRVGRSILATGNGRCNFSHAHIDVGVYRNADFVGSAFQSLRRRHVARLEKVTERTLEEDPVHSFFADLGLVWREDDEGRMYPFTNKATTVLDILRTAGRREGVHESCDSRVISVESLPCGIARFHLKLADGTIAHAESVIIACGGGKGLDLLPERYETMPLQPVLGPLRTDEGVVKRLDNIRVRATLVLIGADSHEKARETGELLFRSYGVSGIAVFNLSRFAEPGDRLLIDFIPFVRACNCDSFLFSRRKRLVAAGASLTCESFLRGLLLPPVAHAVLQEAGLHPDASFEKTDVPMLAHALKTFPLQVRGIGDARQCQIARGGFAVDAFDAVTMESRFDAGLFVAGEALDVDAPCGGYNLHWAWASGLLAGCSAVDRLIGLSPEGD